MISNRLRLNKEELEFVEKRYPEIRMDNLLYLAEGMSSLTYLDLLLSSLRYDLEHEGFKGDEKAVPISKEILRKADYFKKHNGRNYVKGFDPDSLCEKAEKFSEKALGTKIENEFYRIDQLINYIRPIKNRLKSEKDLQRIAIYLGVKLGEMMLEKGLLECGFDWNFRKDIGNPCLCGQHTDIICDPIAFLYRKLRFDSSYEDDQGTASDYFYNFLDTAKGTLHEGR